MADRSAPDGMTAGDRDPAAAARRRHPVARRSAPRARQKLSTIGWREWIALPDLGVHVIKAKIDTGARTSALHAHHIEIVEEDGVEVVHFMVHPRQHSRKPEIRASAPLLERRWVRSSSGERSLRPAIVTRLRWNRRIWRIELTLTDRDEMGFRMLLGRQALRGHVRVDPGRSYLDRDVEGLPSGRPGRRADA